MIDWEITEYETGIDNTYFNTHPKSHKKVYKFCNKCNKGSWVEFRDSHKLCKSCSLTGRKLSDEHKKNMRQKIKNL